MSSRFLKKASVFQKICFKVKVLKMVNISTDCHIKTCRSLKRRAILKIPSTVLWKNLLIFLAIFRCIGTFIRGNGCDICWSAVTCMGGFVATCLVNFPEFEEFLPYFLYGQILWRRKFQTKGL